MELLKEKGDVSEEFKGWVLKQGNLDVLKSWFKLAVQAKSVEEFAGSVAYAEK